MSGRARIMVAVLSVVALLVAAWAVLRGGGGEDDGIMASGTVEATEADLGFQAGGRIGGVEVREGDAVVEGQVLARLDVAELEARLAAAQAQAAAARARLAELRSGARPQERAQALAGAAAARDQLAEAERTLERSRALFEGGAVSREAYEQARTARDVARARYEQAREQSGLVQAGTRAEQIAAQQAAVQAAEAGVAQIDAQLDHAVVRAPFAGVVSVRHREAGESVSPGLPVVTIQDPADRWVRIYVREDQVGRIAVGDAAAITTDSYRDRSHAGRVSFIASEAEFTPRNVQTTEERVKLVYAVKVAITGDSARVLKRGMPADVRLQPRP